MTKVIFTTKITSVFANKLKTLHSFFLFIFILWLAFPVFANTHTISLTSKEITQKLQLADNIRSSDPQQFNQLLQQLSIQSTTQQSLFTREQRQHLDYLNAYQLIFQGNVTQALIHLKTLIADDPIPTLKFRTRLTLLNTLAVAQNWSEGLTQLSTILPILPSIKNHKNRQLGLFVIALFYNQLGQYQLGVKYANQLKKESGQGRNYCSAYVLMIEAKFKLQQLLPFDPIIQQGIKVCQQAGEAVMTNFIRSYLAHLYIDDNETDKALTLLLSHYQEIENTDYPLLNAETNVILAKIYFIKNNLVKTEQYAFKAILQAKRLKTSKQIVSAYYLLYQLNQKKKYYKKALDYHKKYTQADRAYSDEVQTKAFAFQLAEHQALQQKSKINLLDEQNTLLRIQQQLDETNAENNRLFIAILLTISTLLFFWSYKTWFTQKKLKQLAEYDALTGIFNRGHFMQIANSALQHCKNTKQPISCVLFDLDDFKSINDRFGHACGDWVLKKVVQSCQLAVRKNDIFARLGGEEFCILLPSCTLATTEKLSEHCRKLIASIVTEQSGFNFNITASFGVTSNIISGYNLEKLIADADHAMYQSKHNGRNQLTLFDFIEPNDEKTLTP